MLLVVVLLLCVLFIIISTARFGLHPFLSLLIATLLFGLLAGMPFSSITGAINNGFGSTLGHIGIVIVLGTIIGKFLEQSGGALALAEAILKKIGQRAVPLAMAITGYVVSIPVFADSGFIILSSLNRALSSKAGISLAGPAIALSVGLLASHTMVPPTPGPVAAAGIVGADLGLLLLYGIPASLAGLFGGWLFATKVAARVAVSPEATTDAATQPARTMPAGQYQPAAFHAFLPILLPILLIVLKSVLSIPGLRAEESALTSMASFLGTPVIALLAGLLVALTLPHKLDKHMLSASGWTGQALSEAAIIILITGAGGAFGKALQASGIAEVLSEVVSGSQMGIWLPFLIAAAIKTAQGSSTVAIVTTASIIAPLASSIGFGNETGKVLLVLAIGAGSSVVSHANDSFFWVVTQMSGLSVKQGYQLQSTGTLALGLSAAVVLWFMSWLIV